jgi:hypothetical protein
MISAFAMTASTIMPRNPRLAFRTAAQLPRMPTGKVHKPSLAEELGGTAPRDTGR